MLASRTPYQIQNQIQIQMPTRGFWIASLLILFLSLRRPPAGYMDMCTKRLSFWGFFFRNWAWKCVYPVPVQRCAISCLMKRRLDFVHSLKTRRRNTRHKSISPDLFPIQNSLIFSCLMLN